jgi:ribosomal protein S12 methylthiotransferase accessory factor
MNEPLTLAFKAGTHRLVAPAETLARIRPLLARCGITRCTAVTHLDHLGVPVYCAIRPAGLVLQVSNGKGMSVEAAQASALMEALELHHAEQPLPARLRRTSQRELEREGARVLAPAQVPGWAGGYCAPDFRFEWICGESLPDGAPVWAPASSAYFARTPAPLVTDSNGLASGNHLLEASLHGLYELIERDAVSALSVNGRLAVRSRCLGIHLDSIADQALRELVLHIEARDTRVVLLWVPSRVAVHTFWAVLLNRRAGAAVSTFNIGAGCHHDASVAAARAVTEAAQARLTFIHGAREDRGQKPVDQAEQVERSPAYRYFDALDTSTAWSALPHLPQPGPDADLPTLHDWLVAELAAAGQQVLRFDLSRPELGIAVVKMLAPGLGFNRKLF